MSHADKLEGAVERVSAGQPVGLADLDAVTACLTSAFFDDPVWGAWAFPDAEVRARSLGQLMRFWAQAAVRHGWVHMTSHTEATAVWIPPSVPELTSEEEESFQTLLPELFGSRADELGELFSLFDLHHPDDEPHFYLSLWGTHRDQARRGLGTALLQEDLTRIDIQRMPVYLESTNPVNLHRYEALGFSRRSEFGIPGCPMITTMWREIAVEHAAPRPQQPR